MAKWFYIPHKGQRQGPVSTSQLKRLAASGKLQPVDLIWREGMGRWVPARKVQGLIFGAAPPENSKRTPPRPVAGGERAESRPSGRDTQEADWRNVLPPRRLTAEDAPIEPLEVVNEHLPSEPVVVPSPVSESPPADVPVASWHNHLPPVRNPAAQLPFDVPLEPVFVDPPPALLPPVYHVPQAIPVNPAPPPPRKKSARKSDTKKPATRKSEAKKPVARKSAAKRQGERPRFCPRCRRANPSFALFCHFDGIELRPAP